MHTPCPVPAPAHASLARLALLSLTLASLAAAEWTPPRPPTPPVPAGSDDWLVDVSRQAKVDFMHRLGHRRIANILLSNGTGGAVFDFDHDGWMDLFLLNWRAMEGVTSIPAGTPAAPNQLFRNRGDGTFEDITAKAGVAGDGFAYAAAAGDYDNDGFTDLFVALAGKATLYRNRGDGTFEDVTAKAGLAHRGTGISAVFFDADNDGKLDLFVANYLTYKPEAESEQNPGAYPGPLAYPGEPNAYYHNKGDGTFEEATRAAGLYVPGHRGMSVSAFDADWDGDTDLYLSNDDTPNMLWLNDGKGHFREVAMEKGVAFNSIGEAPGSMNAAIGDANGDGQPDLFITRLGYGSLYLRNTNGFYDDRMFSSGLGQLTQKHTAWGGNFFDLDNDGDLDLIVATGSAFVLEGTTTLLLENQGQARFTNAATKGGAFFQIPYNGRGNAILDFDNDGRLDVVLTAVADRVVLLQNRCPPKHHWLKLQLTGTRSNRNGYGARLTAVAGDLTLRAEAMCPTGFLMQSDPRVHFGLGARRQVDRLEIRWPSGNVQVLENVKADQILQVREPQS